MNMYTDTTSPLTLNAARPSPEQRAETNQLMLGSTTAALKRSQEENPLYLNMTFDHQAPKRMKTSTGDLSSEIYSSFLKQQADARGNSGGRGLSLKQHTVHMTQFSANENRGINSIQLASNPFLPERMTHQGNPGAAGLFREGWNDSGLSIAGGLGHLVPSFNNGAMGAFNGHVTSLGSTNGLMLDSSISARQRLGLTGARPGNGRHFFPLSSLRDQSLLLDAAALNNLQGPARHTQLGGFLGAGLSQSDQAFLRGLDTDTPTGLTNPFVASSAGFGQRNQFCAQVGRGASPLPMVLARPDEDNGKLSEMQVFLRQQIEVFEATHDDTTTHTRGRNKPIRLGQVGIRCRHCAHLPVVQRQKGSTYFPASLLGLYQAAQNMSSCHMQSGLCREMPKEIKSKFANFQNNKVTSSGAGRPYWAYSAKKLGLVDTPEDVIRFIGSIGQH